MNIFRHVFFLIMFLFPFGWNSSCVREQFWKGRGKLNVLMLYPVLTELTEVWYLETWRVSEDTLFELHPGDQKYPSRKAIWLLLAYTQGRTMLCLPRQPLQTVNSQRSRPFGLKRDKICWSLSAITAAIALTIYLSSKVWPPGRQDSALVIITPPAQCLEDSSYWRSAGCCINISGDWNGLWFQPLRHCYVTILTWAQWSCSLKTITYIYQAELI